MSGDNLVKIKRTSQAIDNFGFDETYLEPTFLPVVENAGGTALIKQKEIATEETLQAIAGKNYDTTSIDTSDPASIVITYLLSGVLVATETIVKSGSIINIIKS